MSGGVSTEEMRRLAESLTGLRVVKADGSLGSSTSAFERDLAAYVLALVERLEVAEQSEHEAQTYLDELRHIYEDQKREIRAAGDRVSRLEAFAREIADYGHDLDGYVLPPHWAREKARSVLLHPEEEGK